ncbi:MAG: SpoIIE family protein phosphatase [Eubacterium sp.]|nr:SpoIIE family protein phosphatase [Eubacterium sp.]
MGLFIDISYKSYHHFGEELCGDKVEIIKTEDSKIIILADGMLSGVRANIFSTMTSKILGTLLKNGICIDEAVDTITKTLPSSSINGEAYSTFSIIQIFDDGRTYIVEYDNPQCVCIRDHELFNLPFKERLVHGKKITECEFEAKPGDAFICMSDGCIYCSGDNTMNLKWNRDAVADYALKCEKKTKSSSRLAAMIDDMCYDLYLGVPKDDTTVGVVRISDEKRVNIFTGPPLNPEDDERIVKDFMEADGLKIVAGGTSSQIASRVLGFKLETDYDTIADGMPPMAKKTCPDIDIITEGVITLHNVIMLLERYLEGEIDIDFYDELDKNVGSSKIATALIDESTKVVFYVGKAAGVGEGGMKISYELSSRNSIIKKLEELLIAMDRDVEIKYY